ncbi:MAG: hypothetical protein EA389_00390 [Ilumatobacter sp.]|nr:MAG: hypothetical protein EA389_00390 [Ilumatobacter sp.]
MVLGVSLVGLGAFGSSEGPAAPEEVLRTPIGTESEVTTPSAGTRDGADTDGAVPPPTTAEGEGEVDGEVEAEVTPAPEAPETLPSGSDADPADEPIASEPPIVEPDPADDTAGVGPPPDALSLGTAAPVGERYVVTVVDIDLDATDLILAHEPSNEPPDLGDSFVMITLDVVFEGEGEGEPYFDLLVGAVDDGSLQFNDTDCLALVPDDMFGLPPLVSGEGVVGTFCLIVPSDVTDSLVFFVEEHESTADTRVWWSAVG